MNTNTKRSVEQIKTLQPQNERLPRTPLGGLPIRTDLRAGFAWDDLDDQAKSLLSRLADAAGGLIGDGQ